MSFKVETGFVKQRQKLAQKVPEAEFTAYLSASRAELAPLVSEPARPELGRKLIATAGGLT